MKYTDNFCAACGLLLNECKCPVIINRAGFWEYDKLKAENAKLRESQFEPSIKLASKMAEENAKLKAERTKEANLYKATAFLLEKEEKENKKLKALLRDVTAGRQIEKRLYGTMNKYYFNDEWNDTVIKALEETE